MLSNIELKQNGSEGAIAFFFSGFQTYMIDKLKYNQTTNQP
jgi:hypothetical protein